MARLITPEKQAGETIMTSSKCIFSRVRRRSTLVKLNRVFKDIDASKSFKEELQYIWCAGV
jgi:hypothetical protein